MPQDTVELEGRRYIKKAFWMMDTEVTNKMYREFLGAVKVMTTDSTFSLLPDTSVLNDLWLSSYYNYFRDERFDDYPVVGLKKWQMEVYAAWLSTELTSQSTYTKFKLRLPTKAEWQYAALGDRVNDPYFSLGGNSDTNSCGYYLCNSFSIGIKDYLGIVDNWSVSEAHKDLINSEFMKSELLFINDYKHWRKLNKDNKVPRPILCPIKTNYGFPNDFGLYNMCGNVAEMTSDTFVMGGSFKLESHYMRIAKDRFAYPYDKYKPQGDLGFRLVSTYDPCNK